MLKYLFALLLLVHGLIHFLGFSKAFHFGNTSQLTMEISKPAGITWIITAFLFITAALLFLLKNNSWPVVTIVAAILSQVVISYSWTDARFGSIANFIILLVAVVGFANNQFDKKVHKEASTVLSVPVRNDFTITNEMLKDLPPIVQKWLILSGVPGKPAIQYVRLKQKGEMRTKQGDSWMPFTAEQYFSTTDPQFVWQTKVQMMPLVTMHGRDKYMNGDGGMQIKLLSLFNVANTAPSPELNSATMLRYLAEITWFPSAALNQYILWDAIDNTSAKVTMTYNGLTVYGIMKYKENGDLQSFEADRYMDGEKGMKKEHWLISVTGYKSFNGYRIPHKSSVTWKLKPGDFTWANIELTDIEFNKRQLYN